VPVIMLTARSDEHARVQGLEAGADDYVTKPFSPRELTARVSAVLRRSAAAGRPAAEPVLQSGAFEIDLRAREARRAGVLLDLTALEFDLFAHLLRHAGRAFRREELLREVWGFSYGDTSTVTVHVRRLRQKIERNPSEPAHLLTVWGVGYRFDA